MKRMTAMRLGGRRVIIAAVCVILVIAIAVAVFADDGTTSYAYKYAGVDMESDVGEIARDNT